MLISEHHIIYQNVFFFNLLKEIGQLPIKTILNRYTSPAALCTT